MNPKRDELATGELSIEELDAVAAGNIFGDALSLIHISEPTRPY